MFFFGVRIPDRLSVATRPRKTPAALLSGLAADNPEGQARFAAFAQGLQQLGWTDGRNVRIDIRSPQAMSTMLANTRRNWSHSRPAGRGPG